MHAQSPAGQARTGLLSHAGHCVGGETSPALPVLDAPASSSQQSAGQTLAMVPHTGSSSVAAVLEVCGRSVHAPAWLWLEHLPLQAKGFVLHRKRLSVSVTKHTLCSAGVCPLHGT